MAFQDLLTTTLPIHALGNYWYPTVQVDVFRADLLHPVISGNKLYKLQFYLKDAIDQGYSTVATFGGAYSNHIVATAFAAKELGLSAIGITRGEQPAMLSQTLQDAISYGMNLQFVSREQYRKATQSIEQSNSYYWIPEGGYGINGANGAVTMLASIDTSAYTHIVAACGTGTMLAGLLQAALPHQTVIGICVLKGYEGLAADIRKLLPQHLQHIDINLCHDFHFGGYAKHPPELLHFMHQIWHQYHLPTDIVYTAKLVFACKTLSEQQFFPAGSKVLLIHSGGLQGNRSIAKGVLPFL